MGQSRASSLSSDLRYIMNAKLVRRLIKLGSMVDTSILDTIQTITHPTQGELQQRWTDFQQNDMPR